MTQTERIIEYLETHDNITQFEALSELGILRLASRVNDLRRQGYNIVSRRVTVHNRYGEKCNVACYELA